MSAKAMQGSGFVFCLSFKGTVLKVVQLCLVQALEFISVELGSGAGVHVGGNCGVPSLGIRPINQTGIELPECWD